MSEITPTLMRKALNRYRTQVSILKKGYAQEKYRVEHICKSPLGGKLVHEVTSVDIATYRDNRLNEVNPRSGKPISPSTVRLEMSLLSNFFDIGRIEWGVCESNPVSNVRKPKPPPGRDRRMTAREERLILRYSANHTNRDLYSIIVIGLETAMRQGEILKLRWEHIHLNTRIAHLPETKNGSKRDVPLSIKARDALIRMGVKSKGRVFGYSSEGIKSTWRFMLQKLGIEDLHFHDLRHEAISRLFELGSLDVMEVAAISGHRSLAMLKRYTHLKASRLVRKLEGHKHKGRQTVIDHLIPYPALVEQEENQVKLRMLDFEDLVIAGPCESDVMQTARDALLRKILTLMKESGTIPPPDQYLDLVDERMIRMIDPLGLEMIT